MLVINWKTAPDDTTVCYCSDVDLATIKKAVKEGARSITDIQRMTCACTGNECETLNPAGGCCATDVAKIISIFSEKGLVMGDSAESSPQPVRLKKRKAVKR